MTYPLRFLSAAEVQQLVSMREAILLMRQAYTAISNGSALVPVRTHLQVPSHKAEALYMPVILPQEKRSGIKIVALNHENEKRSLPFIQSLIAVTDLETGQVLAIMEGAWITALRTGAGAGFATDLLARNPSSVFYLIGTGGQAKAQLKAVASVRDLKQVYVYNRGKEKGEQFVREVQKEYPFPIHFTDQSKFLSDSDIISTATTASLPLFSPSLIRPGTHINAIGAYRPDMAEIPLETLLASKLVVDQKEACIKEAGEIVQALESGKMNLNHIYAELGEVAANLCPGRTSDDEITLFKSVGNAAQDLVVASFVAQKAIEKGVGTEVYV